MNWNLCLLYGCFCMQVSGWKAALVAAVRGRAGLSRVTTSALLGSGKGYAPADMKCNQTMRACAVNGEQARTCSEDRAGSRCIRSKGKCILDRLAPIALQSRQAPTCPPQKLRHPRPSVVGLHSHTGNTATYITRRGRRTPYIYAGVDR